MTKFLNKSAASIVVLVVLMALGVLWGSWLTQAGVERAIRQNFVAAGLLSQVQVEGEKLRRYEKEMFIYVADGPKRSGYVKEFKTSYDKLLTQLDTMLLPSSVHFTEEERGLILNWKEAAVFYAGEMTGLANRADAMTVENLGNEQRLGLTVEYNGAIKAGKDRFRELLAGSQKMREAKEAAAQQTAQDIDSIFLRLHIGVLLGAVALITIVVVSRRMEQYPRA